MKRLIFIGVALALVVGLVWVPAVAAVSANITIHKTIGPDCPEETFHFEAWRDMNNNGIIDEGIDTLQGTVDITGAGSGVITVSIYGLYVIREVLEPGSVYEQHPDQAAAVACDVDVYFDNTCELELCDLVILKTDTAGTLLPGSCFTITPDPWTGTGSVTVCDNVAPDECPEDGVLCLSGLICGLEVTVEETTVPDGYVGADPQPAIIGETPELTFVNTEEKCELTIYKVDGSGEPLAGACFTITPDPRTGTDSLVLCDNDANDECPDDGVLCLSELICGLEVTVEETTVPDGYVGSDLVIETVIGETLGLTFINTEEKCELIINKVDGSGEPLAGACFTITPDPRTGTDSLVLCDNDANDECPADGVFCLSELICGLEVTVEETTVPDGYVGADPQPAIIGEMVELTFVNTREMDCGTVCAAQTAPGEFLFSDEQENWFTWIQYDIGDGTAGDPYTYPIYTGQTHLCGTLYVYDNGTHIFVNYVLTDMGDCTLGGLSVYHLQVDESFEDLEKAVVKKKNPIPGKCEYIDYFDPMVSETGWIEAVDDDISGWTTAYIFAHGVGCYYCP
ncbi:MAG: hypothetical protein JSW22_08590 [Chloroflexota bacterium]|nr:MAG: hypothetical protein JSW22_08590 [Chloroflexota bacterium]